MRHVAVAAVFGVVAIACARFTGLANDASTSDGGVEAGAAADATSPLSCSALAGAIACFDFDTPPSSNGPNFGFDDLTKNDNAQFALEGSALANAGQALLLALPVTPDDDHTSYGSLQIHDFEKYSTIVLDADVTIEEVVMQYAVLIGFVTVGDGCGTVQALASNGGALGLRSGEVDQSFGSYELGVPFHVHIESAIHAGQQGLTSLQVSDARGSHEQSSTTSYPSGCTNLSLWVGAWYTSQNSGESIRVQYDQIVLSAK